MRVEAAIVEEGFNSSARLCLSLVSYSFNFVIICAAVVIIIFKY